MRNPKIAVRIESMKTLQQVQLVLSMNGDLDLALEFDDILMKMCRKNFNDDLRVRRLKLTEEYMKAGKCEKRN